MGKYAREKYAQIMLWKSTKMQLDRYIEFKNKKGEWSYNDAIRDLMNEFEWRPHNKYFTFARA